ncbi:MAG TPA: cytochrome c [Thiotrichaceae bacterium]|nr:cytochrome c [Thiotrichaceae bacterium]
MKKMLTAFFIILTLSLPLLAQSGKKVFETYCWGCHHQTAVAFGPSFAQIASKRNTDEIRAMITDPASVSKAFGYKRNAMPAFTLNEEELKAITRYILSFKSQTPKKKDQDKIKIIQEAYPNIAQNKEVK